MKRAPAIAAFVGLAVSASASALNLNPMGTGQVLLYPYYTVNANQDTYFSVANQDSIPKVIKVRFLEGRNGRPALDVDVVLKAHDAWTAAISVDARGGAKLVTFDDSCTRPAIPAGGISSHRVVTTARRRSRPTTARTISRGRAKVRSRSSAARTS